MYENNAWNLDRTNTISNKSIIYLHQRILIIQKIDEHTFT